MYPDELKKKPLPAIPEDILAKLDQSSITPTAFEDKNDILKDTSLQQEVGYCRFPDGSYLVSMTCPMPEITPEMIAWWFWWHPQADVRYQVWFPGEHCSISFDKKDKDYFSRSAVPAFQQNTHTLQSGSATHGCLCGSISYPLRILASLPR